MLTHQRSEDKRLVCCNWLADYEAVVTGGIFIDFRGEGGGGGKGGIRSRILHMKGYPILQHHGSDGGW